MTERAPRLRALLFLYSNANIAGCALALAGPVLLFTGLIADGWLLITLGLYGAGYLLARRPPELEREIEHTLTVEQTLVRLDELIARMQPHLNDAMQQHLRNVRESVAQVLPKLLAAQSYDADLFTVRQTVLRYLPETLANYVALPPVFRVTRVLKDGKTARELLADQLALLDDKLGEVVANVSASDAQALLANGQFLEMKFKQPDFLAR